MNTVEESAPGSIMTNITGIEAENTNTEEPVPTYNGEYELSFAHPLSGPYFLLEEFGTLTVARSQLVPSRVLVAGEEDERVLSIRLSAENDEILVKDIYLENDINNDGTPDNTGIQSRVDFKLHNGADQLVQTEQMVGGTLHFELSEQEQIHVPEGGSTVVNIRVDVRDINRADQTGKRLLLALDADGSQNNLKGIEAVTATTGADIDTPDNGWGDAVGENFVAYRTNLAVDHAALQVPFIGPLMTFQEVYRFTISADRSLEVGHLTSLMNVAGIQKFNGNFTADDFIIFPVVNGIADMQADIADIIVQNSTSTFAKITIEFNDENIGAEELKTYALFLDDTVNDGAGLGDDDAVSFRFIKDTTYSNPATRAGQNGTIIWSDRSDPAHTDNTSDWLNGYLLDVDLSTHVNQD
jgi:hypothetical protein